MSRSERKLCASEKVVAIKSRLVKLMGSSMMDKKAEEIISENPQEAELVRRAVRELKSVLMK